MFTWEATDKAEELKKICGCTPETCKAEPQTAEDEDEHLVKKD